MKLAIAGRTGFVGRAVADAARRHGFEVGALPRIRLQIGDEDPASTAARWAVDHPSTFAEIVDALTGCDAVVNAAGLAAPESSDTKTLNGANAALPVLLAHAAAQAGVDRFVHVSSASVQGERSTLDETTAHSPFSAYSRSKALGERGLLERRLSTPPDLVIYRPTSVQGRDREVTKRLVRLASHRLLPVCGRGDAPLPLALVENVGAAALHLASTEDPPQVALHPWEGVTVRRMFELLGSGPRLVPVPGLAVKGVLGLLQVAGRRSSAVAAQVRRIELLAFGQRQEAKSLEATGFRPALGIEGYRALADQVRSDAHAGSGSRGTE